MPAIDRARIRGWLLSGEGQLLQEWARREHQRIAEYLAKESLDYSVPMNATVAHRMQGEAKLLKRLFEPAGQDKLIDELESIANPPNR